MPPALTRLVLYTHKIDAMASFYTRHLGYTAQTDPADRIVELIPPGAGAILMLHPAAKGQTAGQVLINLCLMWPTWRGSSPNPPPKGLILEHYIRPMAMSLPMPKTPQEIPFQSRAGHSGKSKVGFNPPFGD